MKRIIALVLAVLMLLSLCACGGGGSDIPKEYLGKYISVKGEMMGFSLTGEEMAGFEIELKEKGKGSLTVDGESSGITYAIENGTITIKIEDQEIRGAIGNDTIKVDDLLGMGLDITFAKEGSDAARPENYASDPEPEEETFSEPEEAFAPVETGTAAVLPEIDGGVRYDCFAFSRESDLYSSDGTYLVLGDQEAALARYGQEVFLFTAVHAGPAVVFQGENEADGAAATIDGDVLLLVLNDDTTYYMLKEGGKASDQYAFLSDPANLKTPPTGTAPAAESKPEEKPAESAAGTPETKPAAAGSPFGKSVEGATGIVPTAKLTEAAMIVRGGFMAMHPFSYEEIYALMGNVHGKPSDVGWDEATRSHRYEWYPDDGSGDFFSAQFVVVDGAELGKTFQYPGDIYDTDGTPYERKPAADQVGKSSADADGMCSREGFAAFIKQKMEQKEKNQGIEMSYEQIKALCGCDGKPAHVESWKADKHSYTWRVDDDIYFTADFAVLSTGDEIATGGSGPSSLEEQLGLK